jgi:hypothetical protein
MMTEYRRPNIMATKANGIRRPAHTYTHTHTRTVHSGAIINDGNIPAA